MKFPLKVRAVALDLDGTLLDTVPDLARAVNRMLADLALPALDLLTIKSFIGNGIVNLIKRSLRAVIKRDPQEDECRQALEIFSSHYEKDLARSSFAYPGVREGLAKMRAQGLRLCCVTNKSSRFTLPLLRETEIAPFLDLTICGDTLAEKKPHPLPLLHICDTFAIPANEVLMIGDSANDTGTARAAGCPVFCVSYGYGRNIADLQADAIVDDLVQAAKLIELE